jgi:hypothetical protein
MLEGRIIQGDGGPVGPLPVVCLQVATGKPVADTRTSEDGSFVLGPLEPEILHRIEVAEKLTSPLGFVLEEGVSTRQFVLCSGCTLCTVTGRVLTYAGGDLEFPQLMEWRVASTGAVEVEEFLTTDEGSYQSYTVAVCLGVRYKVYVNRGPARWPNCQPDDMYVERNFRRESGTVKGDILLPDGSAPSPNVHDVVFRFQDGTDATVPFKTNLNGYYKLVSLPAGESYDIHVAIAGFSMEESPDSNWTMPANEDTGTAVQDYRRRT